MTPLLILDASSVADAQGVTFRLNQATKHSENPVLQPGEPHHWDSLCVSWPGTVLYSPRDRKWRCWYLALDIVQTPDRVWHTGYAESDDGIHWLKPDLGQIKFLARDTNQVANNWGAYYLRTVFENPLPDAPESQRFGGYWTSFRFPEGARGDYQRSLWHMSLAWSPDGITWTRDTMAYGEKALGVPFQDICQLLHDPDDPDPAMRWKAYAQTYVPRADGSGWPGIRNIGLAHGEHVSRVDDATQRVIFSPQSGIDEEIHFAAVRKVGAMYMMLFESNRFSKYPLHGDLRLAVSNDGRSFRRVHAHTPLIATGPKGMWDENMLVTNSAGWQEVGDEIWIHYFGCPRMYAGWPAQYEHTPERRGSNFAPVFLGVATLPRDRFAYARGPGSFTTHPLEISRDGLWINAEGDGVTLQGANRRGKPGPERRHTVYRKVIWDKDLLPARHPVTLTLASSSDRLFSLGIG
jgi:hypothetical protein